jgi:hypothetical protein
MSGYAPGQTIEINGELNNKSGVTVNNITFKLIKTITYFAKYPSHRSKTEDQKIVEVQCTGVAPGGYSKYYQALQIPAVAPTNLTQSRVIHQTYELVVKARTSGCNGNATIHIPITIGTVPLRQQPESPAVMPTAPNSESQPFIFPSPAAPPLDSNMQENTNFLDLRKFGRLMSIIKRFNF